MSLSQDPSIILKFVKIVERFPDLYDNNSESYRKFGADKAWAMVVDCLKSELNVDSTVDELKLKWKGIRSSYSRYKCKLYHSRNSKQPPKKYYLCDALSYLDPFTRPKSIPGKTGQETIIEEYDNNEHIEEDIANSSDYDPNLFEWADVEIKPEVIKTNYDVEQTSESEEQEQQKFIPKKARKRKYENTDHHNAELQFFKSILPDIVNFTAKEKRTFKIGILELINKIENDRT